MGLYPPVSSNMACWKMDEYEPFISDFPNKTSIHRGFSIAMFDYQEVLGSSYHSFVYH